jgi:hypothetical protein
MPRLRLREPADLCSPPVLIRLLAVLGLGVCAAAGLAGWPLHRATPARSPLHEHITEPPAGAAG